jgi:hypothetical protein
MEWAIRAAWAVTWSCWIGAILFMFFCAELFGVNL